MADIFSAFGLSVPAASNVTNTVAPAVINSTHKASGFFSDFVKQDMGFLTDTTLFGNTLWQLAVFCIIIIASIVIGKIIYYLIKNKLLSKAEKTANTIDDQLVKTAGGPLMLAIFLIGLGIAIDIVRMPAELYMFLEDIIGVAVTLVGVWFVFRLIDIIIGSYLAPMALKTGTKVDNSMLPGLSKGLKAIVLMIGLLVIVGNMGYDLTAIIAILSVASIGVSFALKDTFENIFSGIILYVDRPFKIGDRIKVNDKTYGDVTDIGIRSSKIKNLDNNVVIIANKELVNSTLENYLKPNKKAKKKFNIGLVYGTKQKDMEKAIKIIENAIKTTEGVTPDKPLITFNKFGDFSLNILVIYWIKSLDYWLSAEHDINMKILSEFEKAGLEMAFPTQTIHIEK